MKALAMKLPVALIAVALVFSFAFPVRAQTTDVAGLLEQVQTLLAQIQELQDQIQALREQQSALREEVRELTRTLARGSTGEDVEDLQELLASDPELYPEGLVTGYFGPLTEAAVERLQERFGIEQVGIVGPITRGTINKLFRDLNRGRGSLNRGPGNFFDRIFVDDDELDEIEDDDEIEIDLPGLRIRAGGKGVLICHAPPGNPANAKTIAVGGPAVQAHINHGDELGRCGEGDDDDGDDDDDNGDLTPEERAQAAIDDATSAIADAESAIDAASADGRDTEEAEGLLEDAKDKLAEAEDAFDANNFGSAESLAEEAETLAGDAEDAIGGIIDDTAPVISNVTATDVASTTATITWDTDENADSAVRYSTDSNVETDVEVASDGSLVTGHSVDLTGLATSTEYFYFVESEDGSGNVATSSINSFTTTE